MEILLPDAKRDSKDFRMASALSLESPDNLLSAWMSARYFGLGEDYWDRYVEDISAVQADAVGKAARRYIDMEHLQIVCVGDAKAIGPLLAKFGPLEIYDQEGRRKDSAAPDAKTGSAP